MATCLGVIVCVQPRAVRDASRVVRPEQSSILKLFDFIEGQQKKIESKNKKQKK
jgi:hypothetical protein